MDARELKEILAWNAETVAANLLPAGKKQQHEWVAGSTDGDKGSSLKVHLSGAKAGVWADFATGQKGDLLDLWMAVHNCSLREAIDQAMAFMRIDKPVFEPLPRKSYQKPAKPQAQKAMPVFEYLTVIRQLSTETIQAYGVESMQGEYFQNEEMTSDAYYLPSMREGTLVHWKKIGILPSAKGKKLVKVSPKTEPILFGWQALEKYYPNTRWAVITEGELDALTLFQYGYPALSVPFGGGGGQKQQWTENEYDRLALLDEIFLCLDADKAGQEGTEEIIKSLGAERCRVVVLPYKDANESLQKGVTKSEIDLCFQNAKYIGPAELKSAADFAEDVEKYLAEKQSGQFFYSLPWYKTQEEVQLQPGQLTLWAGLNGHGKSEMLLQTMVHRMAAGERVCIASMEVLPKKLIADHLLHQISGMPDPSPAYRQAIYEWLGERLWIFDLTGTGKSERLLQVFRYARRRFRIDHFMIDSLTKLDITEDDYQRQKKFIEAACDFKNESGAHIHLVVHSRKKGDESEAPGKMDVRGAGAITDLADNGFTVWRNKPKEEALKANPSDESEVKYKGRNLKAGEVRKLPDAYLNCWKQRELGLEPAFHFWFNKPSAQYLEKNCDQPKRYVQFSNTQTATINHSLEEIMPPFQNNPTDEQQAMIAEMAIINQRWGEILVMEEAGYPEDIDLQAVEAECRSLCMRATEIWDILTLQNPALLEGIYFLEPDN